MNNFVGNIPQNQFHPCGYILLPEARPKCRCRLHLSAAMLRYFKCIRCRNIAAAHCILHWIVLTLPKPQMDITLVIQSWR